MWWRKPPSLHRSTHPLHLNGLVIVARLKIGPNSTLAFPDFSPLPTILGIFHAQSGAPPAQSFSRKFSRGKPLDPMRKLMAGKDSFARTREKRLLYWKTKKTWYSRASGNEKLSFVLLFFEPARIHGLFVVPWFLFINNPYKSRGAYLVLTV